MKKEQLGELILSSQETMYHVAKTLLRSDEDCADAIQETIVKAFSKLHTLRSDAYARTWLIRILINECYNCIRRNQRLVFLEEAPMQESGQEQEDYSELYEAVSSLPEEVRLSVTLHYLEGYSIKEVAQLLDTTESAVKNRLMRARKRLRAELTPEVAQG